MLLLCCLIEKKKFSFSQQIILFFKENQTFLYLWSTSFPQIISHLFILIEWNLTSCLSSYGFREHPDFVL